MTDLSPEEITMENKRELVITDFMEPRSKHGSRLYQIYNAARKIWHYLLPRKMVRRFSRAGIRYAMPLQDTPKEFLVLKGRWEPDQVLYLFNTARRRGCDVFLDIGANFGFYSLLAAKIGDYAEVHSFEPHPETYAQLRTQIDLNRFAEIIRTHQIAASNESGEMFIDSKSHGGASVSAKKGEGTVAIKAATLDSVLDFSGRNIAIKMDVEGHEIAALQGMSRLLSRNKIFLQIEIWSEQPESFDWLYANGFRLVYHTGGDFYFANDLADERPI